MLIFLLSEPQISQSAYSIGMEASIRGVRCFCILVDIRNLIRLISLEVRGIIECFYYATHNM